MPRTSRHEVASWRLGDAALAGAPPPAVIGGAGSFTSHTVIVVDRSGFMRKGDVPGGAAAETSPITTRTAACPEDGGRPLAATGRQAPRSTYGGALSYYLPLHSSGVARMNAGGCISHRGPVAGGTVVLLAGGARTAR